MLSMKIALCLVALAFVSAEVEPFDYFLSPEVSLIETPQENIIAVAKHLQRISDTKAHAYNVNQIAKHAAALVETRMTVDDDDAVDEEKAKAYAHNFAASKNAITAALKSLNGQLASGHTHDKNALSSAKNTGSNAITAAFNSGSSKCKGYKNKACPLKREEERADTAKKAAKKVMDGVKAGKVCPLRTTWGDMDVEKSVPKFGTELRNKWDKTRGEYVAAKSKYDAAVRAHQNAINKHNAAMAAFRTALSIEASGAHSACLNAHKEYNALKSEVASNVNSRKQVWVATLVVTCYVDNLTSNSAAKACADKKRSENTSRWNIDGGSLAACKSKATLTNTFGPSNWAPTRAGCGEAAAKEKAPPKPTPKPKAQCKAGEKPKSLLESLLQVDASNSKHASTSKGIFLKGKYIELGIAKDKGGMYGADYGSTKPAGFFGRQKNGKKIGMIGDGDGFGIGKDLRIDYFLPGTHEERFQTGYIDSNGKKVLKHNYDTGFSDTSSRAGKVSAKTTGKMGDLETTQDVSLGENDYFFRTKVTIKNTGGHTLKDVRYGRSCDPDNTVDMGGAYTTKNHIATTFAAGDKFASVSARSAKGDKYDKVSGTEAVLTYASIDKRAIPAYGNKGLYPFSGVYSDEVSKPHKKNKEKSIDSWIGIFVKIGNMAPGASTTFIFDTWMAPATVKVDEVAVAKATKEIAPSAGCIAVPCPSGSTGPNVRSGCKCSKGGTIKATKSAPYYSGSCHKEEAWERYADMAAADTSDESD